MAKESFVTVFYDYDTQWGADRSRSPGGPKDWGHLDFVNTEGLLELHAQYEVPACFAVVGAAAESGERPYHDPEQIRRIHAAGHEIASHSFHHDWLPGLNQQQLTETLRKSKDVLEQCIGAEVRSFVPPFNQPFDYLAGGSISLAERRAAGPDRTDLQRLCETLNQVGYQFCRVAYRGMLRKLAKRVLGKKFLRPAKLHTIGGIHCLRLNAFGFDRPSLELLDRCIRHGGVLVAYGHPHACSEPGSPQRFEALENFLQIVRRHVLDQKIRCALPDDFVQAASHG